MRSMKDITQDAIDIVKPSIDKLFERTNRKELHIVVMNPHLKPWEASFEDAILYEESLGTLITGLSSLITLLVRKLSKHGENRQAI